VRLVDLLRELEADMLLGEVLPVRCFTPDGDAADVVGALYRLAARDARMLLALGETHAGEFCGAVFHLPGFIVASSNRRFLILYVALLVHRYFLGEGGLAGEPERRRRLTCLLLRKWHKAFGEPPWPSPANVKQLTAWLIDGTDPGAEWKEDFGLVDDWAEVVKRGADKW
jgi:hypothetical protein